MAKVLLGVPSGGLLCEESAKASWLCSLKHTIERIPSCTEGLNFNSLWHQALLQCDPNSPDYKGFDYFAMMHTDLAVVEDEEGLRWIDRLIEEMDRVQADFISVPNAIKDHRSVTSSGIGNPDNRWSPFRRFTTAELADLPKTFNAEMIGYGDKFLLHNEALCVFDMRNLEWYRPGPGGRVRCDFNVDERIRLVDGKWVRDQETEDWRFSRMIAEMGMKSYLTSRIEIMHFGRIAWSNKSKDGSYRNGDEDTAALWRRDGDIEKAFFAA